MRWKADGESFPFEKWPQRAIVMNQSSWLYYPILMKHSTRLVHNVCALRSFFKRKNALENWRWELFNVFFIWKMTSTCKGYEHLVTSGIKVETPLKFFIHRRPHSPWSDATHSPTNHTFFKRKNALENWRKNNQISLIFNKYIIKPR